MKGWLPGSKVVSRNAEDALESFTEASLALGLAEADSNAVDDEYEKLRDVKLRNAMVAFEPELVLAPTPEGPFQSRFGKELQRYERSMTGALGHYNDALQDLMRATHSEQRFEGMPMKRYIPPAGPSGAMFTCPTEVDDIAGCEQQVAEWRKTLERERAVARSQVDLQYQLYKEADTEVAALSRPNSHGADQWNPAEAKATRTEAANRKATHNARYKRYRDAFDDLMKLHAQEEQTLQMFDAEFGHIKETVAYLESNDLVTAFHLETAFHLRELRHRKRVIPRVDPVRYSKPSFQGSIQTGPHATEQDGRLEQAEARAREAARVSDVAKREYLIQSKSLNDCIIRDGQKSQRIAELNKRLMNAKPAGQAGGADQCAAYAALILVTIVSSVWGAM